MLSGGKRKGGTGDVKYNYPLILSEGLVVGAITGFVGAGGGFLIIPALVVLANLEIKKGNWNIVNHHRFEIDTRILFRRCIYHGNRLEIPEHIYINSGGRNLFGSFY